MSRSTQFQHVSDVEHILLRPAMYIGSMDPETRMDFVLAPGQAEPRFESRQITVVPALLKIFDEIISNAADNAQRPDSGMTCLKVDIHRDTGAISVYNDGKNVPVELHPTEGVYTPTLVFGSLRTSSNFDDSQQRMTVGVHGIGSKATNIFSREFKVEIVDAVSKLKFQQTWEQNMSRALKPKVTAIKSVKRDYIHVTFTPDYTRFGYELLDSDTFMAMQRRVYDAAATLGKIKVSLNGERIKVSGFKDYMSLFVGDRDIVSKQFGEHWTIGVALNGHGNGLQHVSFVNNSLTRLGGYHVDHVANAVTAEIISAIRKKKKTTGNLLKPAVIKNQLILFINCVIINPSFNSQTKETMTKRADTWGTSYELDSGFIKKLVDSSVFEGIMELFTKQEERVLAKTDGSKKSTIQVEKLDDAAWAGTRRSGQCVLFLTEGDSAKGFAVKGITSIEGGRNRFGVYPLRGKVLNVRDKAENASAIAGNAELNNIKKILGLEHRRDYSDGVSSLRYGAVAILTDADVDGDHIKGLIMNFFDSQFPSLLSNNRNFLMEFITPIIRCKRGDSVVSFYSLTEFEQWKEHNDGGRGWNVKYYKGLATSQTHEIKDYFRALDMNLKRFLPTDPEDREKIDIVFNKKRVVDRKEWLKTYDPNVFRDQTLREHKINDFFDRGMIHFSISDNVRSIPSVVDGLKVSQRKIVWTMLRKGIVSENREIKVAQLAGEVANFTHYHHGEQSLAVCAVLMGQNFVGTNSVNLLYPAGDFGTRMEGPTKTGAPRYIFTYLEPWTRAIFCADDDGVLKLRVEENCAAEPWTLAPIIPMALVNSSVGIGSGFSTSIPSFDLGKVLKLLEMCLTNGGLLPMDVLESMLVVGYRGFTGSIVRDNDDRDKWTVQGVVKRVSDTRIKITELPLTWSGPYKEFLAQLVSEKQFVKAFKNNCNEKDVEFDVELTAPMTEDDIISKLKLNTTIRTSNMVLFDASGSLRHYKSAAEIFSEFFQSRHALYGARKQKILGTMQGEILGLRNKVRFLARVMDGTYALGKCKLEDLENQLERDAFDKPKDLLRMPLSMMTQSKFEELSKQLGALERKTEEYALMTIEQMWLNDLVICELAKKHNLPFLDRTKYIVPSDITVGQFMYVVRKRIQLSPEKALFMFMSTGTIPPTSMLMMTADQSMKEYEDDINVAAATVGPMIGAMYVYINGHYFDPLHSDSAPPGTMFRPDNPVLQDKNLDVHRDKIRGYISKFRENMMRKYGSEYSALSAQHDLTYHDAGNGVLTVVFTAQGVSRVFNI
ncbi:DNA topoisomerase 2 [Allomyces arbusculus]|nr:DNA topoisomerase 2 [Allomyces arbusculus]